MGTGQIQGRKSKINDRFKAKFLKVRNIFSLSVNNYRIVKTKENVSWKKRKKRTQNTLMKPIKQFQLLEHGYWTNAREKIQN